MRRPRGAGCDSMAEQMVVSELTHETERHRGRIGYRQGSRLSSPTSCACESYVQQVRDVGNSDPWLEVVIMASR